MARNNRGGRNNNPEGRNQFSSNWMDTARDRPIAAAATAAAAVGAGVFLWSRRNQISEQLSHLSDQISDWSENMRSGREGEGEFEMAGAGDFASSAQGTTGFSGSASGSRARAGSSRSTSARSGRSGRKGMSETGGGNASLGAHGGTTGSGAGDL